MLRSLCLSPSTSFNPLQTSPPSASTIHEDVVMMDQIGLPSIKRMSRYYQCFSHCILIFVLINTLGSVTGSVRASFLSRSVSINNDRQHVSSPYFSSFKSTSYVPEDTTVVFTSPLLSEGYRPAVDSHESGSMKKKPLLLYLPGFDGTLLSPFLQFPELGTIFDVRGMSVDMSNRSTFLELQKMVIDYILSISSNNDESESGNARPLYLMGESFGGILASSVALEITKDKEKYSRKNINLCGLTLINPATSYLRSNLYKYTSISKSQECPPLLYPFEIISKIVPLFIDAYQLPQLLLILSSKALPSVIDTPAREAYMGRTAFSIPQKLKFMPQETLDWRLNQWLYEGCHFIKSGKELKKLKEKQIKTLVIVGEDDKTLPSLEEAKKLRKYFSTSEEGDDDCEYYASFVVKGAGHASTAGSRADIASIMRATFPDLISGKTDENNSRTTMKKAALDGKEEYFGMTPRYDGDVKIGMLPTR